MIVLLLLLYFIMSWLLSLFYFSDIYTFKMFLSRTRKMCNYVRNQNDLEMNTWSNNFIQNNKKFNFLTYILYIDHSQKRSYIQIRFTNQFGIFMRILPNIFPNKPALVRFFLVDKAQKCLSTSHSPCNTFRAFQLQVMSGNFTIPF